MKNRFKFDSVKHIGLSRNLPVMGVFGAYLLRKAAEVALGSESLRWPPPKEVTNGPFGLMKKSRPIPASYYRAWLARNWRFP
jgi:hypothetical protein